jgi:hypothetical protein
MSASVTQTREPAVQEQPNQPSVPRKRRRRAPVTGATEDCFTCRKRKTKCDRRRPYCSQCIELGKECSGYRTTLTWGVGVASRGKLRGLSLPIPKSPSSSSKSPRESKSQTSSSKSGAGAEGSGHGSKTEAAGTTGYSPQAFSARTLAQDYSLDSTSPIPIPSATSAPSVGWHVPSFNDHIDGYMAPSKPDRHPFPPRPLHKLHTSLTSHYSLPGSYDDAGLSASTGSISAYSDSEFSSPSDFPQTPDDYGFETGIPTYTSLFVDQQSSLHSTEGLAFNGIPRSYPTTDDLSSSLSSSDHSNQDFTETASLHHGHFGSADFVEQPYENGVGVNLSCTSTRAYPHYQQMEILLAENSTSDSAVTQTDSNGLAIPPSLMPTFNLSPRMQFLLDYYDKAICPVLVAFDGPTNPYRMHVMHLAMWNEGLQNAIAALSTNNIRMRNAIEAKRIGFEEGTLPDHAYASITAQELRDMHGEPTPEELRYKSMSIEFLNAQLADPTRAKDDAVLATLLVLCLFHVCDSGFSKFKTQLAGVQKLLSLRDRSIQSNFVGWIEMFFTWFDVMTSCVNDREMQVRGDSFDMMNLSANLGALEHLAGCEGRLFKLIARLGRLNLLSQNRPVREQVDPTPRPSPQIKRRDYYSLPWDRLDGNGWGTPVTETPPSPKPATGAFGRAISDDTRHEFWGEWHDIRSRLQEWELDLVPASPTSPPIANMCNASTAALDHSQRDLLHISESFRYSALIYVERLANPNLPSTALTFQNLVAQSLFHISHIGITSCVNKFLLWPLFITGTECVDENHRAIIRQRCVEIQRESGFFNNLSGLEVLERVWREDNRISPKTADNVPHHIGGQAFRWRRAMDRVDGEYVIV